MNSFLGTRSLLLLLGIVYLFGCAKNNQPVPRGTGADTALPSGPELPTGPGLSSAVLYIDGGITLYKINAVDSSLVWQNSSGNLFASSGSPMLLDSTAFYTGSTGAVAAYSKKNGGTLWLFRWLLYGTTGIQYREPVVTDSLILFTSSSYEYMTSVPAKLHCVNKNTGAVKWSNNVDSNAVGSIFNTTPVLAADKVILITTGKNSEKYLTAYRISDGSALWSSAVSNYSSTRLKVENNQVYLFEAAKVTCYSIADGSLQWQTNWGGNAWDGQAIFFENGQLILAALSYPKFDVYTINTTDGAIFKKVSVQVPPAGCKPEYIRGGCIYHDNKLIVTNRCDKDSIHVRCFNLLNQTQSWELTFEENVEYGYGEMSAPLFANNCIVFPTLTSSGGDDYKGLMHFVNLRGEEIKSIPFVSGVSIVRFAYEEKNIIYNQTRGIKY